MPNTEIIYGPPGTGKTTELLRILEREIGAGVAPERIAFVSFTRKAVGEAKARVADQLNIADDAMPYFRTLHSLCFREGGYTAVIGPKDYQKLGEAMGVEFSTYLNLEDGAPLGGCDGDEMQYLEQLAAARQEQLETVWHRHAENVSWSAMQYYVDSLAQYKADTGKADYSDMLQRYIDAGEPLPIDVMIVDEAQDLTPAQWQVVRLAGWNAQRWYVAGDDDQCIYSWCGADVARFNELPGTRRVLSHSYRLPRSVWNVAQGIAQRITRRQQKDWAHRDDDGHVHWHTALEHAPLEQGEWLILARNAYHLKRAEDYVRGQGWYYATRKGGAFDSTDLHAMRAWQALINGKSIRGDSVAAIYERLTTRAGVARGHKRTQFDRGEPYTEVQLREHHGLVAEGMWFEALDGIAPRDREYYRMVLRNGENVNREPRIRLSTIHAAKGGEADNVLLLTDITQRTQDAMDREPDDEHRVFYVGVTRARRELHLVEPLSKRCYSIT